MKSDVKDFFNTIETSKNLPTLPHIVLKLIETCNREEYTSKELSQIINKDLSLTAKVLRMVNSSYYALPKKVTDIEQAIVVLGMDAIKNIAISTAVYHAFEKTQGDSAFDLKRFWWHSLMCATVAKLIAEKILYHLPEEAFLSGLLHDIGKLVLWVNFPRQYVDIIESSKNHPDFILAGEMRLGATHCRVGAWLINQWHLHSFMADAVLYHHESVHNILDSLPLVKIVYVANVLCGEENQVSYEISEKVFGFDRSEVEGITRQAQEEVKQIAQSLDIEVVTPEAPEKEDLQRDWGKRAHIIREVKDMSLLQGTIQNLLEANDEASILRIVQQGFQVLFDLKTLFFFQYDPAREILVGRSGTGQTKNELLNEVVIPFQNGKNLLALSLFRKKAINSFSFHKRVAPTIIDEQIIRVMGKSGILCLPMVAYQQYVGVLVLAIDATDVSKLTDQERVITMLANQAALAMHAHQTRRIQEEIVQQERLTASSHIARKVVHEVNSPISIIKNYLKVLELKLPKREVAEEELRILNEEVERLTLIVRELSDFSEPTAERPEPLDLNALLADTVKITRDSNLLDPNTNVDLKLDPALPITISEKNRLKQVFMNLIKNAGEAMPDGGNLQIATRHMADKFMDSVPQGGAEKSGYLEINISDDGPGIPETIKARLFEPFTSTKGDGHSGLGLSIVHSTIRKLGGTISCTSDTKSGTSFIIRLPVISTGEVHV